MNRLTPDEAYVLDLLKKDNFRGISKDNVMGLVSILDKVDPEVAKALIAQMPEAVRGMVEIEKLYADLMNKSIESCSASADACFSSEDKIIDTLAEEVGKDIPFEQKQYFVGKMEDAAVRKEKKDTEHRSTLITILEIGGMVLGAGAFFLIGMFMGNSNTKLPPKF